MSDDFLTGGIIPGDDVLADVDDPNAVSSDAFLDDPLDLPVVDELDVPIGLLDDDDELLEDE